MGSDLDSCFRSKQYAEFSAHPNLAKRFLKFVRRDEIQFAAFCVRAFIHSRFRFQQVEDHTVVDIITPLVESLQLCSFITNGLRRRELSTKLYRRLCTSSNTNRQLLPLLFSPNIMVNWFEFWLLPISLSCRNTVSGIASSTTKYRTNHYYIVLPLAFFQILLVPSAFTRLIILWNNFCSCVPPNNCQYGKRFSIITFHSFPILGLLMISIFSSSLFAFLLSFLNQHSL
ncbi:hypothetical protein G6F42_014867 [Rhizopus arrhizus]|nr:hypothetical protein G6F42_014867 [Rhizopus arrhizus]